MEPMPLISFKSSLEKDAKREDIRQARKVLLEKVSSLDQITIQHYFFMFLSSECCLLPER